MRQDSHSIDTAAPSLSGDGAASQINRLLEQAALAQAAALARAGRLGEAEALLSGLTSASAAVLDLRAKIKAQQGDLKSAAALWTKAERLAPGNEEYAAAHRRAQGKKFHLSMRRLLTPLFLALAVFLVAWVAIQVSQLSTARKVDSLLQQMETEPSAQQELAEEQKSPEQLEAAQAVQPPISLSENPDISGQASARLERSLIPAEMDFTMDGVRIFKGDEKVTIFFEEGLFVRGTRLRAGAADLLVRLAERLTTWVPEMGAAVVGCTDDLPMPAGQRYRDNRTLALSRAVVVAEALRAASRLPAESFIVASAGAGSYPYSNSGTSKLRNRTVFIVLPAERPAVGALPQQQ